MGGAWTAAAFAAAGQTVGACLAGAAAGALVAHVPDFDHASRGLWRDYRDWLHCVEPWALACVLLAQVPELGPLLALVVAGAIGSHMLGDSFTTAGIPASILVRSITGRTWGAKLFPSTVRTWDGGHRESIPATVTAGLLTVAGIVLALALGGAL
jgi:membrane-bound metal-dependent hydrolase YbcI (DUF457 family)